MRRPRKPVEPPHGGSEYFHLVAAAERSVRLALERDNLPPVNRGPIMDWLDSMSESSQE